MIHLTCMIVGCCANCCHFALNGYIHIQYQVLQITLAILTYCVSIQLLQQLPIASIPYINTSIKTSCNQHYFVGMPFHTNHTSIMLQFLSNSVRCIIVQDDRGVHWSRCDPAVNRIERYSTTKAIKQKYASTEQFSFSSLLECWYPLNTCFITHRSFLLCESWDSLVEHFHRDLRSHRVNSTVQTIAIYYCCKEIQTLHTSLMPVISMSQTEERKRLFSLHRMH